MANYFSIFLVVITLLTGIIWLVDSLFFKAKRLALTPPGEEAHLPAVVDNAKQFFPIIAFVLVLRSFLYEPFQIPSGSMMPTLLVGDFILVEKFSYGIKDPAFRKQLIDVGTPQRGDIVVFKHPDEPSIDMIKSVVGLPGEKIIYRNKQLFIQPTCNASPCANAAAVETKLLGESEFEMLGSKLQLVEEKLGDKTHQILQHPYIAARESEYYQQAGTKVNEWIVPNDSYFMMGDNRDNSSDGRFWGFVPKENLVGKAVFIWISFTFERKDEDIIPMWVPSGIRFSRVGSI